MDLGGISFEDLNSTSSFIPAAIALTSFGLFAYSFRQKLPPKENRIRVIVAAYLLISFTILFFSGMYQALESIIRYILPLSSLGIQVMQVLFYHFVSEVTINERRNKTIPIFHYYVPILLLLVQSLFYYRDFGILTSLGDLSYYLENYFFVTCSLYILFYTILSLRKVKEYHETLNKKFSGDKKEIRITWLYWVISLKFITVACMVLYALNPTISSLVLYIIVQPLICSLLTFHTLLREYVFVYQDISNSIMTRGGNIMNIRTDVINELRTSENETFDNSVINQKEFEKYFRVHKPYLNADLKITDLTGIFITNRTYLSRFINEIYGMNFKDYVNSWRLMEMDRLLRLKKNQGKSIGSLCGQAGFGSIRSYWRVKKTKE
ncbi:hypothetical protein [Dysgonomonas termitidis]|uniref:HTH araC/xylS-type domain-containing protein n=1 Tax=Dysgonomonas termitidis TaxID=1516126 RepID=A0ABV9L243_9BACT